MKTVIMKHIPAIVRFMRFCVDPKPDALINFINYFKIKEIYVFYHSYDYSTCLWKFYFRWTCEFHCSCSWGCIKKDCTARFTQSDDTYILKEIRPHTCQQKDHKTVKEKITSLKAKLKISVQQARTAKASFNSVEDE